MSFYIQPKALGLPPSADFSEVLVASVGGWEKPCDSSLFFICSSKVTADLSFQNPGLCFAVLVAGLGFALFP